MDSDAVRHSRQTTSRMHRPLALVPAAPAQRFPEGNAAFTLIQLLVVVAIIGSVALLTPSVRAQTVSVAIDGDVILGFRATGGIGAGVNLEVDLGSVSNFYNGANSGLTLTNLVRQDLINTYGANWGTRTDLFWGAAATDGNAEPDPNGKPASTMWATGVPTNAAPLRGSAGLQQNPAAAIGAMYYGSSGSLGMSISTTNSSESAVIPNNLTGSWSVQEGSGSSFGFFSPKLDGPVASVGTLDLYEVQPTTTFPRPSGTLLGSFILSQNGLSFQVAVATPPPVASFSATPTSGSAPLAVTFTNTSTGSITSQAWAFGDGGTSSASSPLYTYNTAGVYTVALTVYGPGGSNTSTQANLITVGNTNVPPPVASFGAAPTSGSAPLTVTFTDTSTGSITSRSWQFGDGNGTNTTATSVVYQYTTPGTDTVQLIVSGPGGSSTNVQFDLITVGNISLLPPVASFSAAPTSGSAPLTVTFTDTSTGSITSRSWQFGDGNSTNTTATSVVYQYTAPGTDTVQLIVSGPGGSITNAQPNLITVGNTISVPPPVALFSAAPTSGSAPLTVTFTDTSTGSITNRFWQFGNGNATNTTATSVVYQYTAPGTDTVLLIVSGPGGSSTNVRPNLITIGNTNSVPPVALFSAAPTSGSAPLTVTFTDTSTGSITNRSWQFGDGNGTNTTATSVVYQYTAPGTDTVLLVVSGPGGSSTNVRPNLIAVGDTNSVPPVASFNATPTSGRRR